MSAPGTQAFWREVYSLFDEAVELLPEDQEQFLKDRCTSEEIRLEISKLLRSERSHDREAADEAPPVEQIGVYRLLREIGRGGMANVYLAERADGEFDQQVALKLMRWEMDSEALRNRFLQERQILAGLRHSHIAQLLDGGLTENGIPYFVMELVSGIPITEYCDGRSLSNGERLTLFTQVCSAVQQAHVSGIVHRDLKPSNILVTEEGQPKLLDFGIAKLLSVTEKSARELTQTGVRPMTPEFAAPEQFVAGDVSTATDVHALGLLLYEILCGARPFASHRGNFNELETEVTTRNAAPPSQAVDPSAAEKRRSTAARLRRELRGDLDIIVLKALRKEPDRRYAKAGDLADDLNRYRQGLPVLARPDSFSYRTGKFVLRHRVGAALTLTIFLSLGAGLALALWQAYVARQQAAEALAQRERADTVNDYLMDVFFAADPFTQGDINLTARGLLARGLETMDGELQRQPEFKAELLTTIGRIYTGLNSPDEARSILTDALALETSLESPRSGLLGHIHVNLGMIATEASRWEQAEEHLNAAIEAFSRQPSDAKQAWIAKLRKAELAKARSHFDEAESQTTQLLKSAAQGTREHAEALVVLTAVYREQGRLEESLKANDTASASLADLLGPRHPRSIQVRSSRNSTLLDLGRFDEAIQTLRDALTLSRQVLGDDHPDTASYLGDLAVALARQGRYDEAMPLLQEQVARHETIYSSSSERTLTAASNLGVVAMRAGDLEAARVAFSQVVSEAVEILGAEHKMLGVYRQNLGAVLYELKQMDEADAELTRAAAVLLPYGEMSNRMAEVKFLHGRVLLDMNKPAEAEPAFNHALSIRADGGDPWVIAITQMELGRTLVELGRPQEAREVLEPSLTVFQAAEHQHRKNAPQLVIKVQALLAAD